ncbi:MAG: hypothetical protein EA365_00290 [Gloeocapsa sp. DLM2.Bin57]|nr:MAG: hypothetical protein EA365_00290 [Gloeocapsa sp. DLM2.Bin57]
MKHHKEIIIYLGPSLPVKEAQRIIDATFVPPAEQGDIVGMVCQFKPKVIALIDGIFLSKPSVWHKEILFALSQGVHVYGASSMGAIRASELSAFGMQGVGKIYQKFASGEFLDDDEVALIHEYCDGEFRTLTEPMVNVRETLLQAKLDGIIDDSQLEKLLKLAKEIYFAKRTRTAIFTGAVEEGIFSDIAEIQQYFKEHYVDIKRQDTIELLNLLKELPSDLEPFQPDFELSNTRLFQTLFVKEASLIEGDTKITKGDVLNYHALHDSDFGNLNFSALNRGLVMILAAFLEVKVSPEQIAEESHRFQLKHNLLKQEAFEQWLQDNHINRERFENLMYQKAICRKMQWWLASKHGPQGSMGLLTEELILQNKYVKFLKQAVEQQQLINEFYPFLLEEEVDKELDTQSLLREHLKNTPCSMDQYYSKWLKEANLRNTQVLEFELIKSKLARKARSQMLNQDPE